MNYTSVKIRKGNSGWGDDMILTPTEEKNIVLSVTNGGIHPVAQRIADLSGAKAVDGFKNSVPDENVMVAVINCGGTARIGIYPKKRIPTVDLYPGSPSGPLAQYITADIFVSAVGLENISRADPNEAVTVPPPASEEGVTQTATEETSTSDAEAKGFTKVVVGFGNAVGYIINTLLSSGRQALDIILKTVLPFMAYVGLLIGVVNYTGISQALANWVTPLASNPFGLILLGIIVGLPFLSPVLGPGAAIAQVVGVLMGEQIAQGALPVQYALPALFAIDGQAGCDFVPVGLSLGEAKPETISVGVTAVLFTRTLTSPLAVAIAYFASFLLI